MFAWRRSTAAKFNRPLPMAPSVWSEAFDSLCDHLLMEWLHSDRPVRNLTDGTYFFCPMFLRPM
jgi:hypothetical protein